MSPTLAPIRERIILAAQTKLATITADGGYYYDIAGVSVDPTFNLLTAGAVGARKAYYVVQPDAGSSIRYYPSYQQREVVALSVMGRMDVDELDPASKLAAWERMGADVEKALAIQDGVDDWFGTLAVDARLGPIESFVGVGSPVVIMLRRCELLLHRSSGQP